MSNVNADIDRMKDFIQDIKRHKEDVISINTTIKSKIEGLNYYWRDKAYETYKEGFVKENDALVKKQIEFYEAQMKDLEIKIKELEEFLDKFKR
jgi:hypothetical protein